MVTRKLKLRGEGRSGTGLMFRELLDDKPENYSYLHAIGHKRHPKMTAPCACLQKNDAYTCAG